MTPSGRPDGLRTGSNLGLLTLACALTTLPPVTGDIYLPALPQLTGDLGGTIAQGQQTLAGYFFGLGVGQLFYGPLADRLGRKPVMVFGAVLYLCATLGCLLVESIQQMILLRFLQALGAGAGVVISAAMIRDTFSHQDSARAFSLLMTARSLGPLLAPLAGGAIVMLSGWRGIFVALGVFGVAMLAAVVFGMKETRSSLTAAQARSESPLRAYLEAATNRRLLGYLATNSLNYGCLFAWIATAPYLIIESYDLPEIGFSLIFAALALGITGTAQLNRRLLRRHSADSMMAVGALTAAIAATALLVTASTDLGGLAGLLLPLFFVVGSVGLVSTNAMAGGLAVDDSRTGSVSALLGTSQFVAAALAAWVTGIVSADPATAMAIVAFACAVGALIFPAAIWVRRQGRPSLERNR